MKVTLGEITRTQERFPGDSLVHQTADLLVDGEKIGTVHDNGYAPQWAFQITPYRWRNSAYFDRTGDSKNCWGTWYGLLFDGSGFDSPELARAAVENKLTRFEALKAADPIVPETVADRLEKMARAVGDSKTALRKRLNAAKACLKREYAARFRKPRFDFDSKRLISDDGQLWLQWRLKSEHGQQTSVGSVAVYEIGDPQRPQNLLANF